jgi:hypothetical protein
MDYGETPAEFTHNTVGDIFQHSLHINPAGLDPIE